MKKIKILRILNRLNLGGPTYNVVFLTKLLSNKFETLLVAGSKMKDEESSEFILKKYNLNHVNISSMSRNINFFNDIISFFQIIKIILKYKPDIVHTHAAKSGFLGRIACLFFPKIIVFHTYHGHVFHSYFNKFISNIFILIEKILSIRTSKIITISKIQKEEICNKFKIANEKKFEIVKLAIDLENLKYDLKYEKKEFKNKYKISNQVTIGIVGRLTNIKNQKFILDIAKEIKVEVSMPITFFIIGDGEDKNMLLSYAKNLGLKVADKQQNIDGNQDIIFTSWIKDLNKIYPGLDIVCNTSKNEGTPLSLIEAMAYKKPIVATNVGGVKDLIIENTNGFCIDINDKEKFKNKIKIIINNKNLRLNMGENGFNYVNKNYSSQNLVKNIEKLYLDEIEKRNKSRR